MKQACQHPDNILAQATLLAGLAIDDAQEAREWFFSRVLPAAWPTYQPITVGDPAGCGSGILLLAAAACFPEWVVRLGGVVFQGIDIDVQCVRMAKINCYLYGLNGYYLKFGEALHQLTPSSPYPVLIGKPTNKRSRSTKIMLPPHPHSSSPLLLIFSNSR